MLITLILIFVVISQIIRIKHNIYRYFNRIEHSLDLAKCFTLYNTTDPIAITDKAGKILWYNGSFFENISNNTDAFGMNICEELGILNEQMFNNSQFNIGYQDMRYNIRCKTNNDYKTELKILFFSNVTAYLELLEEYNRKKPTVAIISIDNYDDMFQNVKESERSGVQAKIEKMLENLTADSNSFQKRLSKDRYLVVFEEQHLSEVIKDRFKILDEARSIKVNDELALTLSIGVGCCSSSLSESEKFAREALDMALGRGGDQAAVKTENGFEFFGGLSKGVEKHSKIKTRIISNAIQKLMDNASGIFIMGHRTGDLDSIGAAIGLSTAIEISGINTSYIVVDFNDNSAKELIDNTMKSNLPVTFIDEKQALDLTDSGSLLIVVDTHKKNTVESQALLNKIHNVVVIDHHRKDINYIDNALLFYHEPYASSASEMITEIIPYFKNFTKLPAAASDALLSGIMLDTKNFLIKTSVRTFEAAAYLRKMGADTVAVKDFFSNSLEFYRMKSEIITSAELYKDVAIAVAETKYELINSMRIISSQAADELMKISNVKASFVIASLSDSVHISARSYGDINVQIIMEKMGGGGHLTTAATQIKNTTVEEARKLLTEAIELYKLENMTDTKTTNQKEN